MSKKTGIVPNLIGIEGVNKPETAEPLPDSTVDQPEMVYSNEKDKKRLMQEHMHLQVGKVQDAVENFIKLHVRDKGEKLHDNQLRTKRCALHLRRYTRARCAKTEAFSVMLQLVGTEKEFIAAFKETAGKKFKFLGTKKHRDGPNDSRHKYRHTFVLSTLIVKDGIVYRLTIILYSRQSVGRFLSNYGPANTFVEFMNSYRKEYNGDIHYEDQYYKDDGAYYVKRNKDGGVLSKNNKLMGIIPPQPSNNSSLTRYRIIPPMTIYQKGETHFDFLDKFGLPSFWKEEKSNLEEAVHVKWHQLTKELTDNSGLQYEYNETKLYEGVDVMIFPENCRRYNHPAIYAHAINILKQQHPELSMRQKKDLCLIGLVHHSSITYYCLLRHISIGVKNLGSKNMLQLYFDYANKFGLPIMGGIQQRMVLSCGANDYVETFGKQKTQTALETFITTLQTGGYYNKETKRRFQKKYNKDLMAIDGIGLICGLSLPCLLLFTGIVTSKVAVLTAIKTTPNMEKKNQNHVATFNDKLVATNVIDSLKDGIVDCDAMLDIWDQALPELDRTNFGDCEQTMCAALRKQRKNDVIIRNMCTYNLNFKNEQVEVNPFGKGNEYQELVFTNVDPTTDCPHIEVNLSEDLNLSWPQ